MEHSNPQATHNQTAANKKDYVYKSTVKNDYGFSESWIKALGEPDKLVTNPNYRSGPKSSLYLRARVEAFIEANPDAYARRLRERRKRSDAAREAARPRVEEHHRREAELFSWALEVPLTLQTLPENPEALTMLARRSFNELALARNDPEAYGHELTQAGVVAFVRHERSNYHDLLDDLDGSPGSWAAYLALKARINAVICSQLGYDFDAVDDGIWRMGLQQGPCSELQESIERQQSV